MKISIITCAYNSEATIADTLKSVVGQTYSNIEHIVVDGSSTDNTINIIRTFPHVKKIISEADEGIYDAMNKGIKMATGDLIGILNSDDFLTSKDVLLNVVNNFENNIDAIFGDIAFVNPDNLKKIIRYYSGEKWNPKKFRWGYMPPHPSFYLKRVFYQKIGLYKTDYKIASDYELLIRMLFKNNLRYKYIPKQLVTMRTGGVSTRNIKSRYILNKEIVRGCKENGIYTNMFFLTFKYFTKIFEYFQPIKQRKS